MNLIDYLRNRKKPTLSVISATVAYAVCLLVLGFDESAAAAAAIAVGGFVTERVYPIFGEEIASPSIGRVRRG